MGAPEVREALFLTGGYGGGEFKKHCWASMSDNLKKERNRHKTWRELAPQNNSPKRRPWVMKAGKRTIFVTLERGVDRGYMLLVH